MKTCPYCAEQIQDQAIICPHCRSDLKAQLTPEESKSKQKKISLWVGLALAFLAAIGRYISGNFYNTPLELIFALIVNTAFWYIAAYALIWILKKVVT